MSIASLELAIASVHALAEQVAPEAQPQKLPAPSVVALQAAKVPNETDEHAAAAV